MNWKKYTVAVLSLFGATGACMATQPAEGVRFVVFADLHHDLMPGGEDRLRTIIGAAEREGADFLLDLGDLVFPKAENRIVPDLLGATPVESYHVIGNHDTDISDKRTYMDFVGMQQPYYTFDKGAFRFVVLDTNHFIDGEGREREYDTGNYYGPGLVREHIPAQQREWLREVLSDTTRIYVVVSHAPINDGYDRVVQNREVHDILTQARAAGARIAAVIAGHIHSDNFHTIDGINYWQVNSASYIWGGEAFESREHYPDSMYARYGSLPYIIPYRDALYAVVELDPAGRVTVRGVQGAFLDPQPDSAKLAVKPYPCSASIEDRSFTF